MTLAFKFCQISKLCHYRIPGSGLGGANSPQVFQFLTAKLLRYTQSSAPVHTGSLMKADQNHRLKERFRWEGTSGGL